MDRYLSAQSCGAYPSVMHCCKFDVDNGGGCFRVGIYRSLSYISLAASEASRPPDPSYNEALWPHLRIACEPLKIVL